MLTREKEPTDLLKESDYLDAAQALGKRYRALALHFLKHYAVAIVVVLIATAALVFMIANSALGGGRRIAGYITTAAAALLDFRHFGVTRRS